MANTQNQSEEKKNKALVWLKKIGFWGFMFFFIKGLIWLAIFYGGFKFFE